MRGRFALVQIGLDCHKRFGDLLCRFSGSNGGIVFATYSLCRPD